MRRKLAIVAVAVLMALGSARNAMAWGHQGHILITRLACLRIINDANAPEGLKAFLKKNMTADMEACKKLAVESAVGPDAKEYEVGIDGACTWPDRVQQTPAGRSAIIEPYGVTESKLHFMDMEFFGKEPQYKADFSNRPEIKDIVKDLSDKRWEGAGYVSWRIEEYYKKLTADFSKAEINNDSAVKNLGYLVHYIEDCTQPHHSTIDYKSYSYLMGKMKAVKEVTKETEKGKIKYVDYTVPRGTKVNPHGDLEFQLFENTEEPRKSLRAEFWDTLLKEIDAQAVENAKAEKKQAPFDGFTHSLELLRDGYEYLPAIGEASIAAYAKEEFDPKAFFTTEVTSKGAKTTMIKLISRQNAKAVLEVEAALRQAWAEAHPAK